MPETGLLLQMLALLLAIGAVAGVLAGLLGVGGGIVFDSDPADEFDETLHKGQTLMEVFGGCPATSAPREEWSWD